MGTQIPIQQTRFIGREKEITDITRLLSKSRLLTLTGPGGCGKTRLAAAVATQVENRYEDGAVWPVPTLSLPLRDFMRRRDSWNI
jgi:MoxR-like ATPase